MPAILFAVLQDKRLQTLVALIALDLLMGVAAAIKAGHFHWDEVGRFYTTQVVPILVGYAAVLLTTPYISSALIGSDSSWLGDGLALLLWIPAIGQLVASIAKSLAALGVPVPGQR